MTVLADLTQFFGNDLTSTASGDIATVTAIQRSNQRILRRLLTNPGDYIWHPEYGAGLPRWIGKTANITEMQALVRGQILLEASVASSPAPVVAVTQIANSDGGGFSVQIDYTEASSGQPVSLSFDASQ